MREPLEPKVMEIILRRGEATVRDILEEIVKERKLSLTTVSTAVSRLYKKGLLTRERRRVKGGFRYVYKPKVTREEYERILAREAVNRVTGLLGRVALLRLIEESASRLSESELREVLKRIEMARRDGT